jgi:hypothetical protein
MLKIALILDDNMEFKDQKNELRKRIYNHITKIESAKDIFDFFRILNYPENFILNVSYKRKKTSFDFKNEDEKKIKEVYWSVCELVKQRLEKARSLRE